MNKLYFKLFSNCVPVKGYSQSIIYDLQLSNFEYIPNLLFDILIISDEMPVSKIKDYYNNEYDDGIDNYLKYLESKEYGFFTYEPDLFPKMDLYWDNAFEITNLIVEDNFQLLLKSNLSLNVDNLTIIYSSFENTTMPNLQKLLGNINCQSTQFFILYNKDIQKIIDELCYTLKKITQIVIYNAPENVKKTYGILDVTFITKSFQFTNTSNVNLNYFSPNIFIYTESQNHHTYFNRKLYINKKGEIKNSPESPYVFGNLEDIKNDVELRDYINNPSFQKLWHITKDKTFVCKDCEYRFMCVDNRIPKTINNETWFHETECNYNPYIAKWKGEHEYKSLLECGVII